jgi:hypothetical protein
VTFFEKKVFSQVPHPAKRYEWAVLFSLYLRCLSVKTSPVSPVYLPKPQRKQVDALMNEKSASPIHSIFAG